MRWHVLRGGRVVEVGAPERAWGVMAPHPLSVVDATAIHGIDQGSRALTWTGPFGASPWESWTPRAWNALEAACLKRASALAALGAVLCLRPHAGHTLSDAQGCTSFLRRWDAHRAAGRPGIELALDPAAMLTPAMLPNAGDHLARMFEALASHPDVSAVVLANVERAGDGLALAPLHRGLVDAGLVADLARRYVPPARVCILVDAEIERQVELLDAATPVPPAHR